MTIISSFFRSKIGIFSLLAVLSFLSALSFHTYAGAVSVNLDQCQNGGLLNLGVACRNTPNPKWANGDLNASNSKYREGDGIPYRLSLDGLTSGDWVIRLEYDFSRNNRFAIDRLTSYRLTQNSNPCAGYNASLCDGSLPDVIVPAPAEVAVPSADAPTLPKSGFLSVAGRPDPLSGGELGLAVWERTSGNIALKTVDSYAVQNGTVSGNSTRSFSFSLRTAACPPSGCSVVVGWSGHVAAAADWGSGRGASSISGAPLHMRVVGVDQADGTSGGNQDRSVQTNAILPPPTETLNPPPTCHNFLGASYSIANNGGNANFLLGDTVSTALSLRTRLAGGNWYDSDIVIVMDRSSSMSGSKLSTAKAAMYEVVDMVAASPNPGTRIALVTFNGDAKMNQYFTTDYNAVKVAISALTTSPGTSIGGGLIAAAGTLKMEPPSSNRRRYIVLASDGRHNTPPSVGAGIAAIPPDVTVYTVGIGNDADEPALRSIAESAGTKEGKYYFTEISGLNTELANIFSEILGYFELQNLSVEYMRDDRTHLNLSGTAPSSSYDASKGILLFGIGRMTNNRTKNFSIDFSAVNAGSNIPLNIDTIVAKYQIADLECAEPVPISRLYITLVGDSGPTCNDTVWNWVDSSSIKCNTIEYDEISNCGNVRQRMGTEICFACSDTKDNDGDKKIDYPLDPGCMSAQDNSERNIKVWFLEF